ncbi:MAG: ATP-dependent helicase PcrA, helicase / ATP-dependent helicase PcrA [Candidatus Adlerbacteria bacterium]|nr:ATP-dependent helicase PcrA, helicase / ATP-dependent helicase PcrA [Candidatus Adlerbacteria bacterium]
MNHLDGLNSAQREAVLAIDGPLLVLAGAGAGKTRVIAHRILEIIRQGAKPQEVLAITFTNKAAGEMRQRVAALLAEYGQAGGGTPFVSTFHSLGLSIIKEHAKLLGYKRTPAIYDRADCLREIKAAIKAVGEVEFEPRMVLGAISRAKGEGISLGEYTETAGSFRERTIASAWALYEKTLREDGAVDFDDLLLRAVELLKKHPEIRAHYQERWRYVHIDEYQDTNAVQEHLAEMLIGPKKNICVVGDPDQTIYGWRGAKIENILHFEKKYPQARAVLLEENYRSTKNILDAANELISNNQNRPFKNLFTGKEAGAPISLYIAGDGGDEALFVARKIAELRQEGTRCQNIAILYRANFQSRALEEKLLAADIPYQVLGTRFFERKEVKDALSFIRAAIQETPADLGRVIDTLPGIGKVTKVKILSGQEAALPLKMRERIGGMRALLEKIRRSAEALQPSLLVRMVVVESGMEKAFKEDKIEGAERLENLAELVSLASRYDALPVPEGLEQFLESAALASDQDEIKEEQNRVRLMTVHAAKGLEFPYVFIVGLEEGLFPYAREEDASSGVEEERRLMYVAITRAEKKLYLSFAMMRTVFGNLDMRTASSFLQELPGELLFAETPEKLGKTIYLD